VAYISYVLLVCPHSPRWSTRMHCSSALILLVGQYLVPVARRPSFSTLAYCSYPSLVGTHSPRRPTALTHRSFDLIFADLHSDVWQKHCVRHRWPTSRACCLFDLIFADIHSDVWQKHRVSHRWPTSRTCCSFVLIRRAGLLLCIARLPSFSTLAYCSYRFEWFDLVFADLHSDVWQTRRVRHRWPTSRICCSFVLIRHASLLLRVAHLPSFSTLAYCSYALLV